MPKVISLSKAKWKDGAVTGDFKDAEFGFLGLFQEILPEELSSKNQKSKGKNKKLVADKDKTSDLTAEKKEKKKKKQKKDKLAKTDKLGDGSVGNAQSKDGTVEDAQSKSGGGETENKKKAKKRKKKAKKRDADPGTEVVPAKKVKFASEGSAEVCQPSRLSNEDSLDEEDEGVVRRIVIDDEESGEETEPKEPEPEPVPVKGSSWSEFYLADPIMRAILDMGFESPTEIQRQVLPLAVRDRCDVLGAAETGSGKTLAYAIPIVSRLLELSEEARAVKTGPKALILAPTRELVVQIMKHVTALLKHTTFQAFSIVGGLAQVKQIRVLKEKMPEVIVATPGRLWAMMKDVVEGEPVCSYFSDWSGLLCLVVDETDRMVEKGHFEEMQDILSYIKQSSTEKLQTLVFSATLTYVHHENLRAGQSKKELTPQQKIKEMIQITGMRPNCKVVDITRAFGTAEALVETRINCSNLLEKDTTVVYLLERYKGRTLIFTNSVDASRRMYGILKLLKLKPLMIHAKMDQKVRLTNLEKFADVAARGLDIKGIDNVIHYQVPKTAEDAYLYKRLCTNLNRGKVFGFDRFASYELQHKLSEKDLPVFPIDCLDLMRKLTNRVKLASALDSLAHKSKKIRLSENWFDKIIREADLEMDDVRQTEQANSNEEMNSIKEKEIELQAELRAELAQPLPTIDKANLPKTRYINPDVIAQYAQVTSMSTNSLDSLEEKLAEAEMRKKKARKLITTHQLKAKKFRKKKP
ncbi:unnamed protein product [Nippostrongylus brasiliensis]|uniref:ATP-dependent RNA helicase n=1 Tax=Nippostrongylus brasiliensis TaxID=27835 RepID=A0A158R2E5_NIPBR|nr:unnamed protein product [Nippostrongylus brasiliensis]